MAITFGQKKYRQHYLLKSLVTVILLCMLFGGLVSYLYQSAEESAYENLHQQTKQIKDDISLQLLSDRENLVTMANFAAKLYNDGESYDLMFDSFEPIGLIANIGILTPENVFETKAGSVDLNGLISFEEEKQKGVYLTGRVADLTRDNSELIRSAVPIEANGEVVGILYGVINLDVIGKRYGNMAKEYDAQLFVYENVSGNLVIDTVHEKLGNISFLRERRYNKDYSYDQMENNQNGFLSFKSAYRDENTYLHYSVIEDIGWSIAMARYDSQVFVETHELSRILIIVFLAMFVIIASYVLILMRSEKQTNAVTACASEIRKILLESSENWEYIEDALKQVCLFAGSKSAVFFNTDGEEYKYSPQEESSVLVSEKDRKYFMTELFRYANEYHNLNGAPINVFCIKPQEHLLKTNPALYEFFKTHGIKDVSFSGTVYDANHTVILAVVNAKYGKPARMLAEKISACFSMALHNKNSLKVARLTATTDALTGAENRVAYKNELRVLDEEKPLDFSCIYIDCNELHMINNLYGHAAGDKMLLYIANTLKEVFYGHKVYRMGGDEFLVFCRNTQKEVVEKNLERLDKQLVMHNYYVAKGFSFRTQNTNTEEMVKEAEFRMYEDKAKYYQNKEKTSVNSEQEEYFLSKTGMPEIDTMLSVLKDKYYGIYRVSLDTDKAQHILMPAYLKYNENEENFSDFLIKYMNDLMESEYHRAVTVFLNYDVIRQQLLEGKIPRIKYTKNNKETVILSIYKLCDTDVQNSDTLWVFEKANHTK